MAINSSFRLNAIRAKKAQVIIISLWILVILTVLAVSIGHRVAMTLRLSRYQKDRLKAFYLAKAGINRALVELEKDNNNYDGLDEPWASSEEVFGKIRLGDNQNEFAVVSHVVSAEGNQIETVYGAQDEERKININTAGRELLLALLERCGIDSAQDITGNILIWRGDVPDDNKVYNNLGYLAKADGFSNTAELKLVKDFTRGDYQKVKELITVYGDGLLNINTASPEALSILAHSIAKSLSVAENFADDVAEKIIELRDKKGFFQKKEEIDISLMGDEETNIFNNLMGSVAFRANNFLIEVTGNISKIKSKVTAVYNRRDKKFLYWHEG